MENVSLSDLIAKERKRGPETRSVDVTVGGEVLSLRFTEMQGVEWAAITSRFPAQPDVPVDRAFGYNVHKCVRAAAVVSGSVFRGDTQLEIAVTDAVGDKPAVNEWNDLFDVMSGPDFTLVADAVWGLNHYAAVQRTDAARKASRRPSARKSGSPKS